MPVEVRRAGASDRASVVELRLAFLADEYDDPTIGDDDALRAAVGDFVGRATASDRWWTWLATDEDGSLAGGLSMLVQEVPPHPRDPRTLDGFVFNVWVRPERRRGGLGRRLVDACLDGARAGGLRRVSLVTTDDGRALYESVGFSADPDLLRLRLDP